VTTLPVPVSVVVLTHNEERNLDACLERIAGWVAEIIVVDSGSTDRTVEIAAGHGARVVTHAFETHARQWAWALAEVPLASEWVLALDADQQVTPELRHAIAAALAGEPPVAGYFVNRRQVFRGRWIRHGGYYPKYLLKLFRRGAVRVGSGDLVDHHFRVDGPTDRLAGDLIEDNRNEAAIFEWIAKHNRYARLQAAEELARQTGRAGEAGRWRGDPDERTLRRKALWSRMPAYVRPLGYFVYRYILRLGFLDGKQGFIFHFMQAWWYRLLVDINIDELRKAR
jgi:glycosyltransferase involved in cell wall biosynthesis